MNKIAVITGTRPQFIDLAPVVHQLKDQCELLIYNTAQHYDDNMSKVFFDQLQIPKPTFSRDIELGITHAEQTATMLLWLEKRMKLDNPKMVVVKGDTNTTLAGALAAAKLHIPVSHIEAGCRAFDNSLSEEINRKVVSQLATYHYAPNNECVKNLKREGIDRNKVFMYGHPVVDSIKMVERLIKKPTSDKPYFMTLHRDFNVDNKDVLERILETINETITMFRSVVFTVHPRTAKKIKEFGLQDHLSRISILDPLDYISCLSYQKYCFGVITDSGGIQKECSILGTPMVTLRPSTEWPLTLKGNSNQLAFKNGSKIVECINRLEYDYERIHQSTERLKYYFYANGSPSMLIAKSIVSLT